MTGVLWPGGKRRRIRKRRYVEQRFRNAFEVPPTNIDQNDSSLAGDIGTNSFDDVNLQDDGVGAPKINLSFGESGKKDSGSNFGFGGWNSTPWGGKNTNNWNFADSGTTDTGDTKASKDTNPTLTDTLDSGWGFGSSKSKKKDSTIGAGFDFGDFGTGSKLDDYKIDGEDKKPDDDFGWPTSKKDKKKKDKLVEEVPDTTTVGTGETTFDTGDTWGTWGTAKKGKKKGKTGESDDIPPVPPPPPDPPSAAPEENWLTPAAGKKKKGKKGAVEEVRNEPPVVVVPEPEADDSWSAWGKKDKSKKKTEDEKAADVKASDPLADFDVGGTGKDTNDIWGSGTKKDKKTTKKGALKEDPVLPETDFGTGPDFSLKDTTRGDDDFWNSIGRNDKDKKKGKKETETFGKDSVTAVDESKPDALDDSWGTWGSTATKGKKAKKGAVKEDIKDPIKEEPIVEATNTMSFLDDDAGWGGGWGAAKKKVDKKSKDTKTDDLPPVPPPAPAAPEAPGDDLWGTTVTKKGKKDKKKGTTTNWLDSEPLVTSVPEPDPEPEKKEEDDWGSWTGLSSKEKKKKEKEREKKKEEEEKKKKKEEEEKRKQEEEEARQKEEEEARKREEDEAKKREEEDKKNKKKGKTGLSSKAKKEDTKPTPAPEPPSALDDSWGSMFTSKKKGKKEVPPPVPTPPAMGLTPEPEEQEQDDWAGLSFSTKTDKKGKKDTAKTKDKKKEADFWGSLDEPTEAPKEEKPTKSAKEEAPSKTVRSIWGSTTKSTTSAKDKEKEKIKEKEKKEKEDKAKHDDLLDLIDEEPTPPPAKATTTKGKASSKLSKTVSKSSDKSSAKVEDKQTTDLDALLDLGDDDGFGFEATDATKAKDQRLMTRKWLVVHGASGGQTARRQVSRRKRRQKRLANQTPPIRRRRLALPRLASR